MIKNKKSSTGKQKKSKQREHYFYGTATVGERGQIVIPHEARKDMGIEKGEKLLVMRAHKGMLALATEDQMGGILEEIDEISQTIKKFNNT